VVPLHRPTWQVNYCRDNELNVASTDLVRSDPKAVGAVKLKIGDMKLKE
jgi:hypothetical protein